MRVLGKTPNADAYRVAVDLGGTEVVAHVPEALLSAQYGQDDKVSHGQAYEWIATRAPDLNDAITALAKGAAPRAPFTHIILE